MSSDFEKGPETVTAPPVSEDTEDRDQVFKLSRGLQIVGAVAFVALTAFSCQNEVNSEVVFIGDSITLGATNEITAKFNTTFAPDKGRYAPNFASVAGSFGLRKIGPSANTESELKDWWTVHIKSVVEETKPGALFVELGWNDCNSSSLDTYDGDVRNVMDSIPPDLGVYWVKMADARKKTDCDVILNQEVADVAKDYPNLHQLPWDEYANPHPEWFDEGGIHPNSTGNANYAIFLKDQANIIFKPNEPSTTTTTELPTTTTTVASP